ncbi:glycerol kinase, partial [Halogeometricum pallidum JCM 14848]
FSPDGDAKNVEERYGRWTDAVERSRDWARDGGD